MTRLVKVLSVAVLVVAGMAAATEMTTTTGTFRYKMTVEVETPEGLKTGSAVREVKIVIAHPEIQGLNDTRAFVKGEAVVVDLGKRGLLLALMHPDDSYRVVFDVFPGPPGLTIEGLEYYTHLKNMKATLETKKYSEFAPMVTFKNINNPKSVVGLSGEHLNNYYNGKIKIKQINVEMTDEAVTTKIENFLPWLATIKGGYLDGKFSGGGPELPNILHGGNFKNGDR